MVILKADQGNCSDIKNLEVDALITGKIDRKLGMSKS